jgi:tetratricopeptide (TPR) repeat protein
VSDDAAQPSALTPLIAGLGLLLLVAGLTVRALTTGGGIELLHPGAYLLFDVVLLCGAAASLLARALGGTSAPALPRPALVASALFALLVLVGAARASHPDLAWRTALTWSSLLLLALVACDLGRERGAARALCGAALGLVCCAAALALWQRFVEHPEMLREYTQGGLEAELGPMDASYRQAMDERIHSPEAAGPFLLPALLACACAMVAPLALLATWRLRRRPAGAALAVVALVLGLGFLQTQSKGGVIAALAALGGFGLLHPRLAPWRARAIGGLCALGGALLVVGLVSWARNPDAEGVGLSLAVRLEYWSAALAMTRDHPLLGVGLNGFRELYGTYKLARAEEALHAHNAAVQVLAELGVTGLLAALGLAAAWARAGLRSVAVPAAVEDGPEAGSDALRWALGGEALGLFLVGAFGDAYSFDPGTLPHLLAVATALPLITWVWLRGAVDLPPHLVRAALLAGGCAFLGDGLTDFGLHHAGVSTLAALLVGLGASGAASGPGDRALRLALGFGAGAVALALLVVVVPGALAADAARSAASEAHLQGAHALSTGDGARGRELLDEAAEGLAGATAEYPWHARTWLERAAVEAARGRLRDAVEHAEAGAARAPATAAAWSDVGALRLQAGDLDGAVEALEAAARRYPTDPGHQLALGAALVDLSLRDGSAAAAERGRDALDRALAANESVRQVSRRLTAEQLVRLGRARARLADPKRDGDVVRGVLRRALDLDDAARAERARGRRLPDPLRALSAPDRADAERLLATFAGR